MLCYVLDLLNVTASIIGYGLDGLLSRRASQHFSALEQSEKYMQISAIPLDIGGATGVLPVCEREHYHGSNQGDSVAFVRHEPWAESWQVQFKEKKRLTLAEGKRLETSRLKLNQ